MDSSESISSSMDTTTDSIDVSGHFTPKEATVHNKAASNLPPREQQQQQQPQQKDFQQQQRQQKQQKDKQRFQRRLTIFESDTHRYKYEQPTTILLKPTRTTDTLDYHDEDTILDRLPPPDKGFIKQNSAETPPPPSTSSITVSATQNMTSSPSQYHPHNLSNQPASSSASTSSLNTFLTCCSETLQDPDKVETTASSSSAGAKHATNGSSPEKKSVVFDRVTVYHFNRSQGFASVPTEGGSTLGMKRKHFLRRRLTVDMYEEVRRRSRRQILLKIKLENRKREDRSLQHQQQRLNYKSKDDSLSSTRISPTTELYDSTNNAQQRFDNQSTCSRVNRGRGDDNGNSSSDKNGDKKVRTIVVDNDVNEDDDEDDDDDESYSDLSDISDSELNGDNFIFLQPIGIKLRRSLLRASGVCRIDPLEKKDCNKIRESRSKSGCKCVGSCIPEYCECSRFGVKCHVDRASFPCGCVSEGCQNPEGRTEFDKRRVRLHFEEKIRESYQCSDSQSNDEELLTTTPTSSTSSEESC